MRVALLLIVLQLALIGPVQADQLAVAAAADLKFALQDAVEAFPGHQVKLTFGSSGSLFVQLENGAPFDLFFSADEDYPRKLAANGLAEPQSLYRYAIGRLVLWVPNGSRVEVKRLGMRALEVATRIAIANPLHAPYGRAAVEAMRHFHLYERLSGKLVYGEDISQAAQFVDSGNADIGVIALSLALAPNMAGRGSYWEVPTDAYPPLRQAAVIMKSSAHQATARAFLSYLRSAAGQGLMRRYGFQP